MTGEPVADGGSGPTRGLRTVFHVSSGDPGERAHALANVRNLLDDDAIDLDDVAVVVNADASWMLVRGSAEAAEVGELTADGVAFKQCSNSMAGRDIAAEDLLDGVEVVSSAMAELTRLQGDGYAYVRP